MLPEGDASLSRTPTDGTGILRMRIVRAGGTFSVRIRYSRGDDEQRRGNPVFAATSASRFETDGGRSDGDPSNHKHLSANNLEDLRGWRGACSELGQTRRASSPGYLTHPFSRTKDP